MGQGSIHKECIKGFIFMTLLHVLYIQQDVKLFYSKVTTQSLQKVKISVEVMQQV